MSESSARQPKKIRVAVIGAGPAGIYASDILLKAERDFDVSIDLFERLPAPYGLVRYGVAPDHPRIKGIINALRETLDRGDIRIFDNVDFGRDITLDDLRSHYHAVIFATGALEDAPLRIPGIDLPGSYGAARFVNWYDGHPDFPLEWSLDAPHVGVVGNGNVALDVARMLAKHADDLLPTEIPANVYAGLQASKITDVHVFGRRGPADVKFTPLELRELGEVPDVDIVLDPADFVYSEADEAAIAKNNQKKVIRRIFDKWLQREPGTASRRLHLHFWQRPVEVLGDDHVEGLRLERTQVDGEGHVVGTGETHDVELGQLYRAVGYYSSPLQQVAFDEVRGVIPNEGGRVIDEGQAVLGEYATGWIKRGPVGLIGSTKSDALETITNLIDDVHAGRIWQPTVAAEETIPELLGDRGVDFTTLEGWHNLDAAERALGEAVDRERVKIVSRQGMLDASRAAKGADSAE
ncbi:FAD-dependent oxidoreductase [Pseudoclavibacter sp. 13-3]|uniref:FAD-dependent oxidoreductase n=1 Tax=Pseudoclavibacter sp. 13-3 TaxID=2901228 RepID=UPI001E4CB029|nr:FAD-dependent oxidoreductase [Pseudoclavibacter sp. 13-3]MCD7101682.1 FAD-dependent oxidoreductase [Pseudoclavibacter sp. 13-3]